MGHLDLTGTAREITFGPVSVAMKESTTFADGGFVCVAPGLASGQGAVKGNSDFAADVLDDELTVATLGAQYPFSVIPNPTGTVTAGDAAWFARALRGDYSPFSGEVGEMASYDALFPYDSPITRGQVAHPSAARTTDGNGTACTLTGPTASQKLYAALHVTAYSGLTNCIIKVQSDDGSGFASATDRITFTTVTGTTSQFASVAGSFSSETHHRVTWDVTGTGSITFVAVFGVI
jgi:hypothetical protein